MKLTWKNHIGDMEPNKSDWESMLIHDNCFIPGSIKVIKLIKKGEWITLTISANASRIYTLICGFGKDLMVTINGRRQMTKNAINRTEFNKFHKIKIISSTYRA